MSDISYTVRNPLFRLPCGVPSLPWHNIYTIEFEFDPVKSKANRKKHGIDFLEAQVLWADPDLIVLQKAMLVDSYNCFH